MCYYAVFSTGLSPLKVATVIASIVSSRRDDFRPTGRVMRLVQPCVSQREPFLLWHYLEERIQSFFAGLEACFAVLVTPCSWLPLAGRRDMLLTLFVIGGDISSDQ